MSNETDKEKPGFWKRFYFVIRVLEVRLRFILVLVITGGLIGYWDVITNYYDKYTRTGTELKSAVASAIEFFCPMHPFVIREEFGKCPICGMDLVERKKGENEELPDDVVARVQISPMQIKEAGVLVEPVSLQALSHTIRAVGAIETNETSESTIAARFPGRVEKLMVNYVGAQVKEGEPVAKIYSSKYLAATYEFLQALQSAEGDTGATSARNQALVDAARQRLLLAGFTATQVDDIRKSGKADPYITYYSPQSGTVMMRDVAEGDYVDEGQSLLSIADLSKVWVQVQVLESDLSLIRLQQPVEIRLVSSPGLVYFGNVNFIYPKVDPQTRTVNVRVELQNAEQTLRPGMYVTAQIKPPVGGFQPLEPPDTRFLDAGLDGTLDTALGTSASIYAMGNVSHTGESASADSKWEEGYTCVMHPDILQETGGPCNLCNCGMQLTKWRREMVPAVPERAVIDTGLRKFVYVESSKGVYDAHEVILGRRTQENQYPVLAGLKTGENVATFGSFLIDAENRLMAADEIYRAVSLDEKAHAPTVIVDGTYKPDNIKLSETDPRQITFDRRDQGECTDKVLFPTLGITVDLAAGQKTVVDIPTTATGEIPFSCGMKMIHGTVTVPGGASQSL